MTLPNVLDIPKWVDVRKEKKIKLPVHGQGVFLFTNMNSMEDVSFLILTEDGYDGLFVWFTQKQIGIKKISTDEIFMDKRNKEGLIPVKGAYYWFSLDSQNQRLYAGIGEARLENIRYEYHLSEDNKSFLESLVKIKFDKTKNFRPLKILRDPITDKVPLYVKDTNELSMKDIACNSFIPNANLTPVCQQLYNTISGKNFVLNTPDFPDFSEAIEYSIRTPECWCYEKLKKKSTEFNDTPNIYATYLRITMGQNNGESPGIPYVMEIWPCGHYSPIHNHSGANAIIRVLSGEIHVTLYPFLSYGDDLIKPFGSADFKKEEITWISTNLNQIHRLKNIKKDKVCITIQCYMYDRDDSVHYDYFDYIDDDDKIEHYEPDSDMEFMKFKKIIKCEWKNKK